MSNAIYRILGRKGRTTIPMEIRKEIGFCYNDILSFTAEDDTVVIKREKLCTKCGKCELETKPEPQKLDKFLDNLSPKDQHDALVYLMLKRAESESSMSASDFSRADG